ncbi:MAG: ImmA/IrrE family metallo-endopeptidase [Planctomycetaceae bacterium]|nr:ImmA/IrrE family metallo-endopeptidase [Planctomycetaceae bacterium]
MHWEAWDLAIDERVGEILYRLAIDEPPVDALHVARSLGCDLAFDNSQAGRARQKLIEGQPAVLLKPDDRPERLQWATAHELGEILAWQICERVDEDWRELPDIFREQLANRFASKLLLPTDWFLSDLKIMGRDLFLLKERYRTASHELIARRLQDVSPEMILTVVDQQEVTSRRNGYARRPGPLLPAERNALQECHESGRPVNSENDQLRLEVWPIHEPGWKREILLTLPSLSEERVESVF